MSAPSTTKERILEALSKLPADATVDDAIERLVFMAKVEEGLASSTLAKVSRTMK